MKILIEITDSLGNASTLIVSENAEGRRFANLRGGSIDAGKGMPNSMTNLTGGVYADGPINTRAIRECVSADAIIAKVNELRAVNHYGDANVTRIEEVA